MKPNVYLETTIASYLTARPSRDLIAAAHQELTLEWWGTHRCRFDLFVSDLVLLEASKGDEAVSAKRLASLAGIPILETPQEASRLAAAFLSFDAFPSKAAADAFHVAIAAASILSIGPWRSGRMSGRISGGTSYDSMPINTGMSGFPSWIEA